MPNGTIEQTIKTEHYDMLTMPLAQALEVNILSSLFPDLSLKSGKLSNARCTAIFHPKDKGITVHGERLCYSLDPD